MASPQLENGYVKIANEIMDALISHRIAGEQMMCLLFIIRKTYGFNKKEDTISNSQFAKATGLKKPNVCRAINELVNKNIVIKNDNKYIPSYRFNKNYNTWKELSKKITVIKNDNSVIKKDNKVLSKMITTKDNKDNIQNTYRSNFDLFWSSYPNKVSKKKCLEIWLRLSKSNQLPPIDNIINSIQQQKKWRESAKGEFRPEWKHPTTWLNQGCWDDECNIKQKTILTGEDALRYEG